jgi:predicted negative regulator of RcsB-dependent stress response
VASTVSRKALKQQDKFTVDVEQTVDFFSAHRTEVIRYGAVALAVVAIVAAVFYYRSHQHSVREQMLANAITLSAAPVGAPATPGGPSFPNGDAKIKAVTAAFNKIISDYSGTEEAYVSEYYLASRAVDAGNMDDARKKYQDVADHAGANYASLAKLALSQLDLAQNKQADAERLLKDLMDHPTDLVSKTQATIAYAKAIAPTRPDEARKLLTQLATDKSSQEISQIASAALNDLPAK